MRLFPAAKRHSHPSSEALRGACDDSSAAVMREAEEVVSFSPPPRSVTVNGKGYDTSDRIYKIYRMGLVGPAAEVSCVGTALKRRC